MIRAFFLVHEKCHNELHSDEMFQFCYDRVVLIWKEALFK